jgi:propanediol dehydratase large subunit
MPVGSRSISASSGAASMRDGDTTCYSRSVFASIGASAGAMMSSVSTAGTVPKPTAARARALDRATDEAKRQEGACRLG